MKLQNGKETMGNNVVQFNSMRQSGSRRIVPSRLRDARVAKGLNQSELASIVGVSRQAVSAFEQGEKGPDTDTMMGISASLGQSISYFVNEDAPTFGETSTQFMRAFGAETKRRNLKCEVLGKWFSQTSRYFFDLIKFPDVKISSGTPVSVSGRYTPDEIEEAAEACRVLWGLGLGPISNVLGLLESNGIIICRSEFEDENIEAFSFWNGPRPFIFLASRKDSAVRARFDAAHELGHLVLHRWIGPEELEDPKTLKLIEAEANRFSGAFLMPRQSFQNEIFTTRLDAFVDLKKRWKVAIQAMVYRCKNLGIFDDDQITNLYKQISFRKWRTNEPLDDQILLEKPQLLQRAAEIVLNSGKRMPDQIVNELCLNATTISALIGVSADLFQSHGTPDFIPSLK